MGKFKSFWIAVFGIEEESKWLQSEQVNIFITAIIPAIISLIGIIITYCNEQHKNLGLSAIFGNEIFINSMQIVVIICTLLVTYRIRRSILVTKSKASRLQLYIKNECNLRDKSQEKVDAAINVVKKTVGQFYFFWIAFWATLLLYYSGNLCFSILESLEFDMNDMNIHNLKTTENSYYNIFNYVSSSLLFALFIILNSVTVSLSERRTGRYGMISAISIMVLFGCLILFPTLYSSALSGLSYLKLQLFTAFFLGIYSAMTFVLFLGKLNTNLQIPRFIFYWLYIYALVQIFQFAFMNGCGLEKALYPCDNCQVFCRHSSSCLVFNGKCHCDIFAEMTHYLNIFEIVFQYITLVGKMFLALTLVWIAYDSRFVHFVLRQSQAITDMKYRLNVFKTYMRDV